MALTVTLTKVSIREPQEGMKVLTVNMVLLDDAEEVYNQNFSVIKKKEMSFAVVKGRLQEILQAAIDRFIREQNMFNNVALDNALANIEAALVTTEWEG